MKTIFNYSMTVKSITTLLRDHGFRLTPQRIAILKVIAARQDHLTPAAIHECVRREYPTIGLVTIYRMLEVLADLDLLCTVHGQGGCRSYLLARPTGHHHHVVCSSCGKVVDFKTCDLDRLERRLSVETGFRIRSHLLEFNGVCGECAE